jgi:predicted DNA-binding transcriptional regulator YafY
MIYTVQAIRKAIEQDKKIRFRYLQYNIDKKQVLKHAGTPAEEYVVSPYATVWNSDRYYLVGWSDKRRKVAAFRIDRMMVPKQLPNRRVPPPEGFDVRDYTDKVFQMYGGPEENVTLKCKTEILDQIIDRFGDDIVLKETEKGYFEFTVPVRVSSTFYGWAFQFVGEMEIVGPVNVKKEYTERLADALGVVAKGI